MLTNKVEELLYDLNVQGKVTVINSEESYLISMNSRKNLEEFKREESKRIGESRLILKDMVLTSVNHYDSMFSSLLNYQI